MQKISISLFLLLFLSFSCKKKTTVEQPGFGNELSKGVNLSNWFNDYSDPGQFGNRFGEADFRRIKNLGFTYLRIPIGGEILFQPGAPSVLKAGNLAWVDAAVQKAVNAGLAVTINFHPLNDDFEKQMATNPAAADQLAAYWKAMATYFKKYSSTQIFYEVFNEPHVGSYNSGTGVGKNWWMPVQEKLVKAIREVDSDHYIIVGGEGWNSIEGLRLLQPYNYPRVVYNFHFYEPFVFTHQGADWVGTPFNFLRNVPYPSDPASVAPLIAASGNTDVKNLLQWYGNYRYNRDTLDLQIKAAADWAARYNVLLICNEFGSFKPYAPRQSRLNCIRDIRSILEKYKIGWAMWEYDEGFGLIDYPGGNRNNPVVDTELLTALGF